MRTDPTESNYLDEISACSTALKNGGVALFPTDSLWGIGCDALNEEAVSRVYIIKKRPENKGLIVLVSNDRMLQECVKEVPLLAWDIIDNAENPITIIYPEAAKKLSHLAAANGSIAIRYVKQAFIKNLIDKTGRPLTSTSANVSGQPEARHPKEIEPSLLLQLDYITPLEKHYHLCGNASRILSLGLDGRIGIIR